MGVNIQDILKYYLEYEIYDKLNSASIKITKKDIILKNIEVKSIDNALRTLKNNKLENEIKKFFGKRVDGDSRIVKQIIEVLSENDDKDNANANVYSEIEKLIEENTSIKIEKDSISNFVNKLCKITNTQEFWIYADNIWDSSDNKKRFPLFILKCKKENRKIDVIEAMANQETIKKILSITLKREYSEISIEYEELLSDYNDKIQNSIDGGDIDHLLNLFYMMLEESIDISIKRAECKINKEYIISLEELITDGFKNIKEDIESLINKIENDKYIPNTLSKYLIGSSKNNNSIDDSKYVKPYYGNYESDYGIGETQYKIVNSIKDNDLIAIEGPPGTGKTSLLKEIIANNIVERANLILENWDAKFETAFYNNVKYYDINWFKENKDVIKSIVVSSKNGEAIENVGKEINKEIRYMQPIARKYERLENVGKEKANVLQHYKGLVCLPLGKQDNIQSFKDFLYKRLIPFLNRAKDKENLEEYCSCIKDAYEEALRDVKLFEKIIEIFKKVKDEKKYFYGIHENIDEQIDIIEERLRLDKEDKEHKLESINDEKEKIFLKKSEASNQINFLNDELKSIENQIKNIQQVILNTKTQLREIKQSKERFEKANKCIINKIKDFKFYRENKNIDFGIKIDELEFKIKTENSRIEELIRKETEKKEQKVKISIEKEKLEKIYKELENKFEEIEKEKAEIELIELFNEKDINKYWQYKNIVDMYGHSLLNELNQELFFWALKLNEAYILKNAEEIIENLKLFLMDGESLYICQKFYDSKGIYSEEKEYGIKCLWNTLFLCFPVVTTTLDSFSHHCFHLLPEYIDLELIDEAGQILSHNLVPALYRTKKAVIVGDVNQIEPIYNSLNKKFEKHKQLIGEAFDNIKIDGNSVQTLANRNTDILNDEETIILNEHYRCEKNIVNFANKTIYGNKLIMHKNDDMNKPFSNNMVALDIRGKKNETENVNLVEIESCMETIRYILEYHKDDDVPSIAVITPFKRQKEEIEKKLKEAGIQDVKVGTVHAFQGQQKDYIIFSQVIDSLKKKYLVNFIGKRCNMLNVAVTRAKKQFVFIGNIDVAIKSENFTTKLIEYIQKNGALYSLYNSEKEQLNLDEKILSILQSGFDIQDDNIGLYIRKNFKNGILDDAKEHYEFLKYAIQNAKEEIYIMSPWYRDNVINDKFEKELIKLKEKNCKIKINFGYKKGNTNISNAKELAAELKRTSSLGFISEEMAEKIADKMYQIIGKDNFVYAPPTHAKILIIDGKYMCIGSHNWLSNAGNTEERSRAKEVSIVTTNKMSISYAKEELFI